MRPGLERSSYAVAGWLFRRLLGMVYVAAFASLAVQVRGLMGEDGILPAREYLAAAAEWTTSPIDRIILWPTLGWLGTSDAWLIVLCLAGVLSGLALALGWLPLIFFPLLWLDYLSLTVVGGEFFAYQWDALLLETGFLAIFIAPAVRRDRLTDAIDPPRAGVWLAWWLLFRLMMGSGLAKLASGDPTWTALTAMTFHFETQPLPTPLAWYAHQLPVWVHRVTSAGVLVLELVVPLFVFAGRRMRHLAAWLFIGLQVLIALTGNYAFFGTLTASLALLLVDDTAFERVARRVSSLRAAQARSAPRTDPVRWRGRQGALIVLTIVTLPLSIQALGRSAGLSSIGGSTLADLADRISAFRFVNSYGLFAVMTTTRPEIVVEGSTDGIVWTPYEFRYKPGDPTRSLPWVAPHQPRLDWQMWFAALGDVQSEPWFARFLNRLLAGSPQVVRLLAHDPFAGSPPPRFVRATLYRYRLTSWSDVSWWTRTEVGAYSPIMSGTP